jgi:diaminohydroxyphosphoribosylaminopyrimidine deaminase/5-amino-6-(5-phosphoribosylamino)uracil reductase
MNEAYMRRALELAARGLGRTSPNPAVGAVVVRAGAIVGEGHHRRAGAPHAEREALANAGEAAEGADLYVTLEPCCHRGRTPPCTEAIVEAGIARVAYACGDPDPRARGRGCRELEGAGIEVEAGMLEEEAERLNEAYLKHKRTGRPFVTLKLAMTLDGKIATRSGESRWITGEAARRRVHEMRDRSDAVMVGVGTVLADDPRLTTRGIEGRRDALRVICDSRARTPPQAQVVRQESDAPCLVAVTGGADTERVEALEGAGAEVLSLPARDGRTDLEALSLALGERDIMSVLLEGGGTLAWGALEAGIVDKVALFYAPMILGGEGAVPAVGGAGIERITDALRLRDMTVERVGDDLLVEGYVCSQD